MSLATRIERLRAFVATHHQLFPPELDAAFLARFAIDTAAFAAREDAIKAYLHDDPRLVTLCALACASSDWGSVGRMSVAMTPWGRLSCAFIVLWHAPRRPVGAARGRV